MRWYLVAGAARRVVAGARAGMLCFAIGIFLLPIQPAVAIEPRVLGWSDLIPEALTEAGRKAAEEQQRITSFTGERRELYARIAEELLLRARLAAGDLAQDALSKEERELLDAGPSEQYPGITRDIRGLQAARERVNALAATTEPTLNGTLVRIPGYVLPLEFEGTQVSEFLLVPFVGACIHVPAPPPNQMVLVRAAEAFEVGGLYEPVWVEGVLSTQGETRQLSLVDGQAPVDAGYSLGATQVTPYQQ